MTKEYTCTQKGCDSDFQDKTYGKGRRVHNLSPDGKRAKCTVCGNKRNDTGK